MKECIYCKRPKPVEDFTLEHVIPQCLGGAYAPDKFKTRDVCGQCNNNLGLFVDASFEKNWFVSQFFREAAYALFDPAKPVGLPLTPMGSSDLMPPELQEDDVCESWLGPLGEQVYWIRPKDARLYWYVGGNPRTTKKVETRAYFQFSERSTKNALLSWLTFRDAFEGRRVRKIMCTIVDGADPADIGFAPPDRLDAARIEFFRTACSGEQTRKNSLAIYTRYDVRFMAKLALGVGYSLFGEKILSTDYTAELQKALWHREGEQLPDIQGTTDLAGHFDQLFKDVTGHQYAVTLLILPSKEGVAVNLNLGSKMNWIVKCASLENLDAADIEPIKDGVVIILYKYLQRGFTMTLPEFIAYKGGMIDHNDLATINNHIGKHSEYFKNL